jgi:hypothetical protein
MGGNNTRAMLVGEIADKNEVVVKKVQALMSGSCMIGSRN